MKQAYIKAVLEQLLSGKDGDVIIKNLKVALAKKGHLRLLGAILRGTLRQLEHEVVGKAPQISVAKDGAELVAKAKAVLATMGDNGVFAPVIKTDENLVGGYVVTAAGKQVDASYKRALLNLYRKVIN